MRTTTLISAFFIFLLFACTEQTEKGSIPENPNFLIFFIDDLRPELGCYDAAQIHSPNIDKLAKNGLRFDRAYCNVPVCGASRASLLSGIRPGPQRFVGFDTYAQEDLPGHVSLPAYFKKNGYYTVSYGKIYHHQDDMESSWSEPPWRAKPLGSKHWRDYLNKETVEQMNAGTILGPPVEKAISTPDSMYLDGQVANAAVRKLRDLAKKDEPFMFWVGYLKPHLPFNAPEKYWDMYDRDELSLASNPEIPSGAPKQSMHTFGELRQYDGIPPKGPLSDEQALELRHGYYACVSYTDALIGQVMAELERLDLDKNTIVAVFGDHGWNLGEHGLWCKHCNYNTSLHVPLIINIPGVTKGESTSGLVEYIDLFPTFADLAGLAIPSDLDGKSLTPLIADPAMEWAEPVYSRYVLGNSIVTEDLFYTEFMRSRKDCTIVANMLYDHRTDPDENINISGEASYRSTIDSLSLELRAVHFGD